MSEPGPRPSEGANRSLQRQLALALAGTLVGGLGFVVVGTYAFVFWGEYRFYDSLSPEARAAYVEEWAVSGMPSDEILREIALAEEQILGPVYEAELHVVLLLSALVIVLGIPIAIRAARHLTRPLEMATDAARAIAGGELGHRIEARPGAPAEVASLVRSFTHLAESLERMEQNVRFTSASVAHEIRTPLTVVQGYLQGIRDGVFEADEERLDAMLGRLEALNRLLDDLKTLSLAESGRLKLEKAPVELAERLRLLVDWLEPRSAGELVFEGDEALDPTAIEVDVARIEQVVLGLIHNARRYAGEGAAIRVCYERQGERAMITVEDDGPGFTEQALERASERFWRGESSGSRETGGSGLGLAVARAVIEAHGGELSLANRPRGGALVRMGLPITGSGAEAL